MTTAQHTPPPWSIHCHEGRAETQMTLGKLIVALEAMPEGAEVANLKKKEKIK